MGVHVTVGTSLGDIGVRLAEQLAEELGSRNLDLYFKQTRLEQRQGRLCLLTPNRFVKEWIERRFAGPLQQAASAFFDRPVTLDICIEPEGAAQAPSPARRPVAPVRAAPDRPRQTTVARLRYDLRDFVVGQANQLAYRSAVDLVQPGCRPLNPLFIYGGCGLGKTHLVQGVCRRFADNQPQANWRYMTAEQFTNDYINAVRHQRLSVFRQQVRKLDLLALDDVQFFAGKTGTQTELQHTIDALLMRGAKLILASDGHPTHRPVLSPGLVSRWISGMVARIDPPDRQMLPRLVGVLAERRGLRMRASAIEVLAERLGGSVRELEGALTRLQAMVLLDDATGSNDQPIGHAMLNQVLWRRPPATDRRPVRFDRILQIVCRHLNVTAEQVFSPSRQRQIVLARSLVVHLARVLTDLSYPELARQLGRSSHSTIITADQRIRRQVRQRQVVRLLPELTSITVDQLVERLRDELSRADQHAA